VRHERATRTWLEVDRLATLATCTCPGHALVCRTVTRLPHVLRHHKRPALRAPPQAVGFVQGLSGLAMIIASYPVGVASDFASRRIVARVSACLDALAGALTLVAVLAVPDRARYGVLSAAVLWGMTAACDPSLDALYADSVSTGHRAAAFTNLLALARASRGFGSLLAAAIFAVLGELLAVVRRCACALLAESCKIASEQRTSDEITRACRQPMDASCSVMGHSRGRPHRGSADVLQAAGA
jgi:hypothetical protein